MTDAAPSERELDILKTLWQLGEARVRDVHAEMCPNGECAFTTIQTLLRIMEEKGLVKLRTVGRTRYYKAKYSPQSATSRFLSKVFDGSLDQMVLSMLEGNQLSKADIGRLEKLILEAKREKSRGGS